MKNEKYRIIKKNLDYFYRHFSFPISHLSSPKGFTLIEFMLVMSIFGILVTLATVNLFSFQHKSQISSTINIFMADLKGQQIKAMAGDTSGDPEVENYGINFDPTNFEYILYKGNYSAANTANFAVEFPDSIEMTTSAVNSQLVFEKGTGEIGGATTVTLRDTVNNDQKVIQLNRYGVVTGIN